jgi:2-oxoglutarate ferredoxin oxidoreductase subunit beta
MFVKGFQHKGYSFFEAMSNCHVNLGRKNKMGTAMDNLKWIDSITVAKSKYDKMSEEERAGLFPTGILKHDEDAAEYTELYKKVQEAHQNNTKVDI